MKIRKDWRQKLAALVEGKEWAPICRQAGLSPTYLRDTLKKPNASTPMLPKAERLSNALGVPITDWFLEPERGAEAGTRADHLARQDGMGGRIKVLGMAECGPDGWSLWNGEVVDMVARPPNLAGVPNAYAVFITGDSMADRYLPGEVAYIHPGKPATPGSFVLVQMQPKAPGEAPRAFLKRLVKRSGDKVILEQSNPPKTFTLKTSEILSIHRVVGSGEP